MSITISSTTDSQEAVNAAAGIATAEVPEAQQTEEKLPVESGRPTPDDEPEEEGDEDQETDEGEHPDLPPQPKRKGGWQRKIEALNRQNGYAFRRIQELEQALARNNAGEPQQREQQQQRPAPAAPPGRPTQDQFATYEEYHEALTDWKLDIRQQQVQQMYAEMQRRQADAQNAALFRQRAAEFSQNTPDFGEVMAAVDHIPIPDGFKRVLFASPASAQVAYELAKNPAELERLTYLAPDEARLEIARMEGRLSARSAPQPRQAALQKLPPQPIRPVGQGAATRTMPPLDEMSYQDFKAARNQQIAARRGR